MQANPNAVAMMTTISRAPYRSICRPMNGIVRLPISVPAAYKRPAQIKLFDDMLDEDGDPVGLAPAQS